MLRLIVSLILTAQLALGPVAGANAHVHSPAESHATVGAVYADLKGQDAASGAAAGATSSLTSGVTQNLTGDTQGDNSQGSALQTGLGQLAALAAGGDQEDIALGGTIASSAYRNNYLNHTQRAEAEVLLRERAEICQGRSQGPPGCLSDRRVREIDSNLLPTTWQCLHWLYISVKRSKIQEDSHIAALYPRGKSNFATEPFFNPPLKVALNGYGFENTYFCPVSYKRLRNYDVEYIILHCSTYELCMEIAMVMVKKSISVTDQQNNWIKAQIETGHYGNESEIMRELIRERQMREQETSVQIKAIRAKLIEGEQSGFTDQSADDILAEIKSELRGDGNI